MLTLTLLSHKGGSGKSTLALGLGVECATTRGATCIIDIDPQGTSVTWSDQRGEQNDPRGHCNPAEPPGPDPRHMQGQRG